MVRSESSESAVRSYGLDSDTASAALRTISLPLRYQLLEATAAGLSSEAMDRVIALYWRPVYRFIRLKFRRNNEDAKDLTQGFFAAALQRDFFARFDPAKASFRTYLRMAVERFAANQYAAANRQKRGGDIQFEPLGTRGSTESPEQALSAKAARVTLSRSRRPEDALRRLWKQLQFCLFEAYDLADAERPSYAELAVRHGIPKLP